ncbi:hypothetical protein B5X24_HaOG214948 [Helicoverpa armigera]|uniref:Uncharacterized protein n=1 Tax=Helicoverpa armigera TaxID=29058 RepID=A0A2W1B9K1_HELAM|nr:hypothetical protein B5X24_HaOG214948 [Helicoverpa armigera]
MVRCQIMIFILISTTLFSSEAVRRRFKNYGFEKKHLGLTLSNVITLLYVDEVPKKHPKKLPKAHLREQPTYYVPMLLIKY